MASITSSADLYPIASGEWYRLETTDPITLTFQPSDADDLFYIYNDTDLDLTNVTFVLNDASTEKIYIITDGSITTSLTPMYGNFICDSFNVRDDLNLLYGTICGTVNEYTSKHSHHTVVSDIIPITKQKKLFDVSTYVVYLSTVYIPTYTEPVVSDPYIPETTDVPVDDTFYSGEDVVVTNEIVLNERFGTEPLYVMVVT